jgi:hypothetical protein
MHGIVFSELQKFVETAQGNSGWSTLLKQAQLEHRVYLSTREYPDAEIDALVSAAATITGRSATAVLEAFGEFIALPLMNT